MFILDNKKYKLFTGTDVKHRNLNRNINKYLFIVIFQVTLYHI